MKNFSKRHFNYTSAVIKSYKGSCKKDISSISLPNSNFRTFLMFGKVSGKGYKDCY